jgi:transposase-like protein
MTNFKSAQYPKDVILYAVFVYVRYGVSSRYLEEIMKERGLNVGLSVMRPPLLKKRTLRNKK